ncbi:hypothetical protein HELRODRAFT_157599 [Helobdella robusta]|uniref:TAR DNA-binding protein 43 n=1 Tax=Helobdella robusta TaxID=6412 RepID=T1EMD7_HELRO|nr:hypothetical protein HELRODRAFT_157599 [Helobdella robusta]ESN96811.1 hypothetical protein HELRODRAFT_157599 [Helobdella robusta]
MSQFVQVVDDDGDEPIELPTEPNSDLLLSTVVAQFPGVCGLKYKTAESKSTRGVRLVEGRLIAPDEGWASYIFLTVYPKVGLEAQKRKGDPLDYPGSKSKKLDKMRCSDLIVLGLPWKSTEDDIRKYFSTYGELTMVQLKVDHKTKQSKGFGFIRFADYESQLKALSQKHLIDGRWCNLRIPNSKCSVHPELSNKIYVGRLTEDMTSEDLHEYFSQFGEVREVFIPKPFRAFAFVSFADPFIAQSLYGDDHVIKNVSVHIGTATPKNSERYMNDGYGSWQGLIHI